MEPEGKHDPGLATSDQKKAVGSWLKVSTSKDSERWWHVNQDTAEGILKQSNVAKVR